jgi:hypothetical protein
MMQIWKFCIFDNPVLHHHDAKVYGIFIFFFPAIWLGPNQKTCQMFH